MTRRKPYPVIEGIKAKVTAFKDWNSHITVTLDTLFLQTIAGAVPYHHFPRCLVPPANAARGEEHSKAPRPFFPQGYFFVCEINDLLLQFSLCTVADQRSAQITPGGSRAGTEGMRRAQTPCSASSASSASQRWWPPAPKLFIALASGAHYLLHNTEYHVPSYKRNTVLLETKHRQATALIWRKTPLFALQIYKLVLLYIFTSLAFCAKLGSIFWTIFIMCQTTLLLITLSLQCKFTEGRSYDHFHLKQNIPFFALFWVSLYGVLQTQLGKC